MWGVSITKEEEEGSEDVTDSDTEKESEDMTYYDTEE